MPAIEEDSVCLRSRRGLVEVWQVSVDGMSGVGGGIGGSRQVERLWYCLFLTTLWLNVRICITKDLPNNQNN